mgnify:CR=1 FL=1
MTRYIIRLDDACPWRDIDAWKEIEALLDSYGIKPLVGIIPKCEDPSLREYQYDGAFWDLARCWQKKGWIIAMHGFNHVYSTEYGGVNPVNARSEFAGESLSIQRKKIKEGLKILELNALEPRVFFAPSHTFDKNTLIAIREESNIRIISDTVANRAYFSDGFTFVPLQSGRVRRIPLHTVTFCYHPNIMTQADFDNLESFLRRYSNLFVAFPADMVSRRKSLFDSVVSCLYFFQNKVRHRLVTK